MELVCERVNDMGCNERKGEVGGGFPVMNDRCRFNLFRMFIH